MSLPFSLEPDEGIILNDDDTLVLTNKRLVEVQYGLFWLNKKFKEIPLYTLKIINDEVQVFLSKESGDVELEAYTFDGNSFTYEFDSFKEARKWADAISNLLVGHPSMQVAEMARERDRHRAELEAASIRGLGGLVSASGKYVTALAQKANAKAQVMREQAIDEAHEINAPLHRQQPSFGSETAYVISDSANEEPAAAQRIDDAGSGQQDRADERPSALSFEEQVSRVKSLKELLDAGIITQDEFDQKKRELLGL